MKSKAKFILSKSTAIEKYNELKEHANMISYSYKTNKFVGKILQKDTSCFFSVHNIQSVNELGEPNRIWFFLQSTNINELKILIDKGIFNFVVDNINDLNILQNYVNKKNQKISLLLRMRLQEHTIHTGKHFVFGMYSKTINELLPKLKKNSNIIKLGIHFHRKTQNVSEWSLKEELIDSIKHWELIDYVNIGGGLPAEYKNYSSKVLEGILNKINELKTFLNKKSIKMIIEPGRFIAAPSVKLEATIINIYDNNIVLDCSIFNAAMDTWIANIRLNIKEELENGIAYVVKGCTPDSADILRYKVFLKNPKIGDRLIFLNAGAYNFHTDFCNLNKIPTVIVD